MFDVISLMKREMVALNNDYSSFLVCVGGGGGEVGGTTCILK